MSKTRPIFTVIIKILDKTHWASISLSCYQKFLVFFSSLHLIKRKTFSVGKDKALEKSLDMELDSDPALPMSEIPMKNDPGGSGSAAPGFIYPNHFHSHTQSVTQLL